MKLKVLSQIFIFFGFCMALETCTMKQLFKGDKKDLFKKTFFQDKHIALSSSKKYYNNAALFSLLNNKFVKTDKKEINNKPVVSKKTFPLQQKKSFEILLGFNKNKISAIPPTGYFAQRLYTVQTTPQSRNNDSKEDEKVITIDPDKPESEKQVFDIINTWKEQPLEGKRFYSALSCKKILKRTAGGLGVIMAAVAAGAAYFYDRLLNMAHESNTPLPEQESYRYPERFYKYALDGEKARTMDPVDLVKELHRDGLTSEDPPRIQCQMQEDEIFKKIIVLTNLTEHDQRLVQNIWNLRHSFFNGHYNKNNVTYKGTFDLPLRQEIDSTLEKADIPFKLTITDSHRNCSKDVVLGCVGMGRGFNLKFNYHIETGTAGIKKNTLDLFLYVNPDLKSADPLFQKSVIAHEATHILNLDRLQDLFFFAYLNEVKKVDVSIVMKCIEILDTMHEYQADLGPLSKFEYAQAQKHRFEGYKNRGEVLPSDKYIPVDKMVQLSSRAVALHEAEKELEKLPSSWARYFGFKMDEAQN